MILKPRILASPDSDSWADFDVIITRGLCQVMLTGVDTVERLYEHCSKTIALPLKGVRFLYGEIFFPRGKHGFLCIARREAACLSQERHSTGTL
jgi:hypothetical protein